MRLRIPLVLVLFVAACSSGGGPPSNSPTSRPVSSPMPTPTPTSTPTPLPGSTPDVPAGGYFIGGMDGEVCEPKAQATAGQAYWNPTEELCIHAAAGAGVGSVSYSPTPEYQNVPASDGSGDTFDSRVQRIAGVTYQTTAINSDKGGFGSVSFAMNSFSANELFEKEAQPTAQTRSFYVGLLARPGDVPYGVYAAGTSTVDPQKGQDIIDSDAQMGRIPFSTFNDDQTGSGGSYTFSHDDPAIAWLLSHNIVPLFEIDAGPKQYGTSTNATQQPLMHNPTEYANFCTAVVDHLQATYPAIGTSVPAYFTTPINEPNSSSGWDASQTDNPTLYAETASGPALYMQSCYAAIKAVFPSAKVYGGELATNPANSPSSMPNEISRWYSVGCRIGSCFDGVSLHISPIGDPSQHFTRCYETDDGWTFACLNEMQAVSKSYGDPTLHAMITETGIPSVPNTNVSAGDEPGQAWWESQVLASAQSNPDIDAVIWGNLDEDALYQNTVFYGTSLIDTSTSTERRKAAFYTFCRFADYPNTCNDPIAPVSKARNGANSARRHT